MKLLKFLLLAFVLLEICSAVSETEDSQKAASVETNERYVRSAAKESKPKRKKGYRKKSGKKNKNKKVNKSRKKQKKTRKDKKKDNKKKGKKVKLVQKGRRRQHRRKTKPRSRQTTCSADEANSQCLINAQEVLIYEGGFVTNYLKQSKQLESHGGQTNKKLAKKGEFKHAAEHMLIAIGGNISNPYCGSSSSDNKTRTANNRALDLHLENYGKLMNCSNTIKEACTPPPKAYNASIISTISSCTTSLNEFKNATKKCMTDAMKKDVTKQCACWKDARDKMDTLKAKKCSINDKKKEVTKQKRKCLDVFIGCKKMEDQSVSLIHTCMDDHSMKLLNMTASSLNSGAIADSGKDFEDAGSKAQDIMDGKVDIGKHVDPHPSESKLM